MVRIKNATSKTVCATLEPTPEGYDERAETLEPGEETDEYVFRGPEETLAIKITEGACPRKKEWAFVAKA